MFLSADVTCIVCKKHELNSTLVSLSALCKLLQNINYCKIFSYIAIGG